MPNFCSAGGKPLACKLVDGLKDLAHYSHAEYLKEVGGIKGYISIRDYSE